MDIQKTTALPVKKAVVLGATGGMGNELVKRLLLSGIHTAAFSRSANKLDELKHRMSEEVQTSAVLQVIQGDVFDINDVVRAADGADIIFQSVNVPYIEWKERLVPLARTVIDAARTVNVRIAVIDNIYAYGRRQQERIDEQHPKQPHTRKGRYRLAIEQLYLNAHHEGVPCVIFRLPDFYGPYTPNSILNYTLSAMAKGKSAMFVGNQNLEREYIYMPDAAEAVVRAACFEEAYGRTWNIPGAGVIKGKDIVRIASEAVHYRKKVGTVGKLMIRLAGLFNAQMREVVEMLYLTEEPLVLNGGAYESHFGPIPKTPYEQGIRQTILALKAAEASN